MAATMWGPVVVGVDPTAPENYGFPSASWPPGAGQITQDTSAAPGIAARAGAGGAAISLASPDSPMFWVGLLLAVTLGAVGFNAHARVLSVRTGVDVGSA